MRMIADIFDSFSTTVRVVVGLLTLAVMGFGAITTLGVSWAAPQVAESFAERAEQMGEKAIEASLEAERSRELARDGWGYGAGVDPAGRGPAGTDPGSYDADDIGGWGR